MRGNSLPLRKLPTAPSPKNSPFPAVSQKTSSPPLPVSSLAAACRRATPSERRRYTFPMSDDDSASGHGDFLSGGRLARRVPAPAFPVGGCAPYPADPLAKEQQQ